MYVWDSPTPAELGFAGSEFIDNPRRVFDRVREIQDGHKRAVIRQREAEARLADLVAVLRKAMPLDKAREALARVEGKPQGEQHDCHCPIEDWRDLPTSSHCLVCKGKVQR
jgi:hypothetical protein